jgi:hypothetical protein
MVVNYFKPTIDWIKADWHSSNIRFCVELFAWALSIGAAVLFAFTVPNIPFFLYLSMTITGCALYALAAWSRGSFGMLANYIALTAIDTVGMARLLMA